MKINTIAQALEIIGGLSNPSKMPCHSYGISAYRCITGAKLQKIEGSTCSKCYALKGMYGSWNKNVTKAHEIRLEALDHPLWIESMIFLVHHKKMDYFRWHDSGDLQSFQHLLNLVKIAERCPDTKFWLPTREKKFINQFVDTFGNFPKNLIVRLSSTMIDENPSPFKNTSTVHKNKKPIGKPCSAINGKCNDCRDCWNPKIKNISYSFH